MRRKTRLAAAPPPSVAGARADTVPAPGRAAAGADPGPVTITLESERVLAKAWLAATFRNQPEVGKYKGVIALESWNWDDLNLQTKRWLLDVAKDVIDILTAAGAQQERKADA